MLSSMGNEYPSGDVLIFEQRISDHNLLAPSEDVQEVETEENTEEYQKE